MVAELDKSDLIAMARGREPSYKSMELELIKKYGKYSGGHNDAWHWDMNLLNATEQELLEIIYICKKDQNSIK